MGIIKVMQGNIIKEAQKGSFDLVVHGCNCFCTMGAGVAKQIKLNFPRAYEADKLTTKGDKGKLGTYTKAIYPEVTIINAYTQYAFSSSKATVDYQAIQNVFTQLNKDFPNSTVGIPKIGAGLARGDWNIIEKIINDSTPDLEITLILLP